MMKASSSETWSRNKIKLFQRRSIQGFVVPWRVSPLRGMCLNQHFHSNWEVQSFKRSSWLRSLGLAGWCPCAACLMLSISFSSVWAYRNLHYTLCVVINCTSYIGKCELNEDVPTWPAWRSCLQAKISVAASQGGWIFPASPLSVFAQLQGCTVNTEENTPWFYRSAGRRVMIGQELWSLSVAPDRNSSSDGSAAVRYITRLYEHARLADVSPGNLRFQSFSRVSDMWKSSVWRRTRGEGSHDVLQGFLFLSVL